VTFSPVVIGRDPSCAVVLNDPEVSFTHCELRADRHGVLLRDLGSRNGTFVNTVRVREGLLTAQCALQLGASLVLFEPAKREHVEVSSDDRLGDLVGVSAKIRLLFRQLREVAPTDLSVLITGETGTGKELVAKAIHENSRRSGGPFIVVNCTTIPGELAESHLFGYEKGAFTGADRRTEGAFHAAHGGTMFLDELGELPVDLQRKLLRAIEDRRIQRVGTTAFEEVDVRVVAATLQNLGDMMNTGRFRRDLFFRVAQVRLELPPLRERREDIIPIVKALCARTARPERTQEVITLVTETLRQHDWPGNVRELANVVRVVVELPPGAESLSTVLPAAAGGEVAGPASPFSEAKRAAILAFESGYFARLVEATGGNVSEMARRSGMERHHVRAFLRKHGLAPK
jgi:DNA-binding NtrC family response regulator